MHRILILIFAALPLCTSCAEGYYDCRRHAGRETCTIDTGGPR